MFCSSTLLACIGGFFENVRGGTGELYSLRRTTLNKKNFSPIFKKSVCRSEEFLFLPSVYPSPTMSCCVLTLLCILAEPPSFIREPEDTVVAENQDAMIHCRTFGAPVPVITWTVNGTEIKNDQAEKLENGTLLIKVSVSRWTLNRR